MSGLGQSGKWDGSRDPDRLKNARRDDYNFVYFTPDEMHLNTSLWDLLFLQDTIMKIFKKFLHIITLGENINPRSTCWIKCKMCFDALTLYWVIKLNYFPQKMAFMYCHKGHLSLWKRSIRFSSSRFKICNWKSLLPSWKSNYFRAFLDLLGKNYCNLTLSTENWPSFSS